jgi:AcrR family transcriptional regulator
MEGHCTTNPDDRSTNVRKGAKTRRDIIRKAAPIFNQKGYDGPALSDLMRATGLERAESTGTLQG